jgi:hypothetical protein
MVNRTKSMDSYFPFIAEEDFESISAELSADFRAAYPTFQSWRALVERWRNDPELSEHTRPVRVTHDQFALLIEV